MDSENNNALWGTLGRIGVIVGIVSGVVGILVYFGISASSSSVATAPTPTFTTIPWTAPVLLSPADGVVLDNSAIPCCRRVQLQWTSVAAAATYNIEITYCAPQNRSICLRAGYADSLHFTTSKPFLDLNLDNTPSSSAYTWVVTPVRANGEVGPISKSWSFAFKV
jgi:hypothetical protein